MPGVYCVSFDVCCVLRGFVVCYLLFAVCCMWVVDWLFAVRCVVFMVRCVMFVVCGLRFIGSLFVAYCLFLLMYVTLCVV